MHTALKTLACASAAIALLGGPSLAQARGGAVYFHGPSLAYHGGARYVGHGGYGGGYRGYRGYGGRGGYWGPGLFLGGLGVAVGIAALNSYPYGYVEPAYPVYVPVPAPAAPPVVVYPSQAAPAARSAAADPIIYPRNGQSAAQTEADRQECNRWATTQPSAMADASVFQRATFACLDGRGYTVR